MHGLTRLWHLAKSSGRPMTARVSRWRALARRIIAESDLLVRESDDVLLRRAHKLQWQARANVPLDRLLADAYALVREASRRVLGKPHYEAQLIGGIGLFEGGLAEMQTGEGKTLTATLPVFLRALRGLGCHVVTVNDYLAERDCELMAPVYRLLGLTVGCVVSSSEPLSRRHAYQQDITYATSREIGFDFLRDRLKAGHELDAQHKQLCFPPSRSDDSEEIVQRGHHFALIDEADSVLIDDAGTPLIIALNRADGPAYEALLNWSRDFARHLDAGNDYVFNPSQRSVELTNRGVRRITLAAKPPQLASFESEKLYVHVEQALRGLLAFQRGRDYVVTANQEIAIVDEGTGRILDGRKWQAGLHQAIEAKEHVPITDETKEAARITVQTFFRRYDHLAGMTGTALPAAKELHRTYSLQVTVIPTNRRCIRKGLPTRVFVSQQTKREALIHEIVRLHSAGRAILIGTPSVDASEALGSLLGKRSLECRILNALFDEQEAEIVAEAGQPGRITIATNMAGRGTDIHLHEHVRSCGGLHVFATELHSNRRIDRQLIGRAARQGDPGSYQLWLSLEDELFRSIAAAKWQSYRESARPDSNGELPESWLRVFRRIQKSIERRERQHRKQLLKQEQVRELSCKSMGLDPYLEVSD
jgi:preprotein translocase subunit SecA